MALVCCLISIIITCLSFSPKEYFPIESRKRRTTERKRSAAQVLSHENRGETKRQRFECTSAVKPEDIDTTTTDVTDTDVRADEDSVKTTGTPV